jgi:hypothetical protein
MVCFASSIRHWKNTAELIQERWNAFAWIFGAASMSSILANLLTSMWALFHPDYTFHRWHAFIAYLIMTWITCACVLFANRLLPAINQLGLIFILAGVVVTILVCAIMPSTTGSGHASNDFVWRDFENLTGYSSSGFAFLSGMLNGAYSVGVPGEYLILDLNSADFELFRLRVTSCRRNSAPKKKYTESHRNSNGGWSFHCILLPGSHILFYQ